MGLLNDPQMPTLRLHVALRQGNTANAKAPKLTGYVMVTKAQAQQLLEVCTANVGEEVTFLQIGLWQSRKPGGKFPLEGGIQLSTYDPSVTETQPAAPTANQETSHWY